MSRIELTVPRSTEALIDKKPVQVCDLSQLGTLSFSKGFLV